MQPLRQPPFGSAVMLALAGALAAAGCKTVPEESFRNVQRELNASQERITRLESQLAAEQETVRSLTSQLSELASTQGDPAEVLIVPERIELASMSGGYDDDGVAGDDGLVVYVQPYDRDGHIVKAAGTFKVRLIDPQAPPDRMVIQEWNLDAPTARAQWYGRLWTNHFRIKCPWPDGKPPAHNTVSAFVIFTELLTGKSLTATGTYQITPPASLSPTTQP